MAYNVAIVGIGMVGTEMLKVLRQRKFPAASLRVFARSSRTEEIAGERVEVEAAGPEKFAGVDIAFFAGTEGAKGASQLYGWTAVEQVCELADRGFKGLHNRGIELSAGALADLLHRLVPGTGGTVGSLRDHGVEGIRKRRNPGCQGNPLSSQAVWVSAPVPAFVMPDHHSQNRLVLE